MVIRIDRFIVHKEVSHGVCFVGIEVLLQIQHYI